MKTIGFLNIRLTAMMTHILRHASNVKGALHFHAGWLTVCVFLGCTCIATANPPDALSREPASDAALVLKASTDAAIRMWKSGDQTAAVTLLTALASIPTQSSANNQSNSPARQALEIILELLSSSPDANVKALFSNVELPKDAWNTLVHRLQSDEIAAPAKIRHCLALAGIYRHRFKEEPFKPEGFPNKNYVARQIAFKFWMSGEEELAYQVMFESYRLSSDPEGRFDSLFAEFTVCLGRGEQALADLELRQAEISSSFHSVKRAYLLRALGRSNEAAKCTFDAKRQSLLLELQIETSDWDHAILTTSSVASDDNKKREALRAYVAYLSGNPVLYSAYRVKNCRALDLLHCDEDEWLRYTLQSLDSGPGYYDLERRSMAQDALIAATSESSLLNSISSREPVAIEVMDNYFRTPDLLPDRNKAVRLARAIADTSRCRRIYGGSTGMPDETVFKWGHKMVAAAALIQFGHGDWAFDALRSNMEECKVWSDFPNPEPWSYSVTLSGYRYILKLSSLEWPDSTMSQQVKGIACILSQAQAIDRARGIIELAAKHSQSIEKTEMQQIFALIFRDLAEAAVVPEELKAMASSVLSIYQLSEQELKNIRQRWSKFDWEDWSSKVYRASLGKSEVSFKSKGGDGADPKQQNFVMLDGLTKVKKLCDQGEKLDAASLLKKVMIRMLLDESVVADWQGFQIRRNTSSSSSSAPPHTIALICFNMWDMPADLVKPYIGACWRQNINYSSAERMLWAARLHAKLGENLNAIQVFQLYLLSQISTANDHVVDPRNVAEYINLEALLAAERGERPAYLSAFRKKMQIQPYAPSAGAEMVAPLRLRGDAETLAETAKLVDTFWTAKLLEIPECGTYKFWWKQWKAAIR